jgi:acetylornithine deacetylase/succinyl-diaminopimelate desuccinylase-like protein
MKSARPGADVREALPLACMRSFANGAIRSALMACACWFMSRPLLAAPISDGPNGSDLSAKSGMTLQVPPPKPLDYGKLTQEAAVLLSKYIQIDTTNPPGNELPAAKLLREKFLEDGVPATVWEPQPGRGIVAARLHGGGHHTKALLLLSHLDVPGINPHEWQVPPFSGQIKDGAVWGRGALDGKVAGVIELMGMLAVKRSGILLNRDVVFLATCDHEQGGKIGAGWVVSHEAKLFNDAGYFLNEGGSILHAPNGRRFYVVSITEKVPLWLRLTAQGPAASTEAPPDSTAVNKLIRALDRLLAYQPPIRIIDPVRDYFRGIGQLQGGPSEYGDLAKALHDDPEFAQRFLANSRNNAFVRATVAPTRLMGSNETNVIPMTARAEIDVRLLPGDNPQEVEGDLIKALDDKSLRLETILNFPATSSTRNSQLMNALSRLAQGDDARVVPAMALASTDSHYFREKGLIGYGFIPIEQNVAAEEIINRANEHIPVKELGAGIYRMAQLLKFMGAH